MFEMVIRFVLLYLVPLLTMAMFYSEIVLHLWKRKVPGVHIDKNQKRIEKQKRKVVTMLVTIATVFAICWLLIKKLEAYGVIILTTWVESRW